MGLRSRLNDSIQHWMAVGKTHDIPPCCAARYAVDREITTPWLGLPLFQRLSRLSPRHALATRWQAGVVPCELHVGWWLVNGHRPRAVQKHLAWSEVDPNDTVVLPEGVDPWEEEEDHVLVALTKTVLAEDPGRSGETLYIALVNALSQGIADNLMGSSGTPIIFDSHVEFFVRGALEERLDDDKADRIVEMLADYYPAPSWIPNPYEALAETKARHVREEEERGEKLRVAIAEGEARPLQEDLQSAVEGIAQAERDRAAQEAPGALERFEEIMGRPTFQGLAAILAEDTEGDNGTTEEVLRAAHAEIEAAVGPDAEEDEEVGMVTT